MLSKGRIQTFEFFPMGICELVSENWTYMVSMSHMMEFGMLLMIGRVILDKTQL